MALNIDSTLSIENLLKNDLFLNKLFDTTSDDLKKFTEIYNDTDYLMKSLNTQEDNVYIKCKPVDDNGNTIEPSNNLFGPDLSSLNSMLTQLSNIFNPEMMYNNVGLQTLMAISFLVIIYSIGNYLFIDYPKSSIARRIN